MQGTRKALGLAASLGLLVTLAGCGEHPAGEAYSDFMTSVAEGDYETAKRYLDLDETHPEDDYELSDRDDDEVEEARQKAIKNDLRRTRMFLHRRGGIDEITILEVEAEEDGDEASVMAKINFNIPEAISVDMVTLYEDDGRWRLENMPGRR